MYSRMDQVKAFKGCLPQILLGPLLNTLSLTLVLKTWLFMGSDFFLEGLLLVAVDDSKLLGYGEVV